jgi:hypothetical protein
VGKKFVEKGMAQGEQKVLNLLKQGYTVDAIEKMLNQQNHESETPPARPTA